MEVLYTGSTHLLDKPSLSKTINSLKKGEVICYPTETFYAFGVAFQNRVAEERLYRIKGRPAEKDLPFIASDIAMVEEFCDTSHVFFRRFADVFWPGPLTLVLYARDHSRTLAIRVSAHRVARQISAGLKAPLVSTSANLSGHAPFCDPSLMSPQLHSEISLFVHDGVTDGGLPSTIITLLEDQPRILRKGVVSDQQVFSIL